MSHRCRMPVVPCEDCGVPRLGAAITDSGLPAPHAPRIANEKVRAMHPGPWPTCRHGIAWQADCLDRPVPPTCCRHPPCVLVPPVPPHPIPSVTFEES
ncbi:hypothetical protein [Corallococcus silvisoli]|uniref:hypothetical protein n=1 Tax=Corallococcus silvisoli TaxID=2697031 RepID=UPI001378A5DE|nr:hypothetical protein [Corallococcus silvisoli]NBD09241.1 hypothetical protein [Corallococcus silvisoli]